MNIRSKRILLRAMEQEDLPQLQEWSNDPEIAQGLGDIHFPTSRFVQQSWYERTQQCETTVRFIVENAEGESIGMTGFWSIRWRDRRAEHAVLLGAPTSRGKGYGREVIVTCARYAFDEMGLYRLDATVLDTNQASLRAYEGCGYKIEGRQREHVLRRGKRVDRLLLGLTLDDFRSWCDESESS